MREHPVAQIRLATAREAVNVYAPAVAKETLQTGGAKNQQWIIELRIVGFPGGQRRIDAALDQPGQSDAGKVGGDERNDAENDKPAIAVDEKLDALIVTKNLPLLQRIKLGPDTSRAPRRQGWKRFFFQNFAP
jgi:hypothetical protein